MIDVYDFFFFAVIPESPLCAMQAFLRQTTQLFTPILCFAGHGWRPVATPRRFNYNQLNYHRLRSLIWEITGIFPPFGFILSYKKKNQPKKQQRQQQKHLFFLQLKKIYNEKRSKAGGVGHTADLNERTIRQVKDIKKRRRHEGEIQNGCKD